MVRAGMFRKDPIEILLGNPMTVSQIARLVDESFYFDDTALPLWQVSDAGLKIAAHFYNSHNKWNQDDGVL